MMKRCAVCGHDCKPSAFSCTACGESTWVTQPPVSDDVPTVRRPPNEAADMDTVPDFPARKPARSGARGARGPS